MITPADSAPIAPEQMPASSFSIQAPDSDSSAPASTIHGLDKSFSTGAPGTPMALPADTTTGSNDGAYYDPPRSY